MAAKPKFQGLTLSEQDLAALRQREREPMGMLVARRIHILRLLHRQRTIAEVAEVTGTYRREVRRVAHRYLQGGLVRALSDEPRRPRAKILDSAQTKALIALVCGPPPEGRTRWTLTLLTEETRRRNIAGTISRETIRRTLASQDIKPWREKMWCIPAADAPFVERMKDVLELYAKPHDAREPVVVLDERPVVLRDDARPGRPTRPGKPRRRDYEYVRKGTANIFCIVEPKTGRHLTHATTNRKRRLFAYALARIAKAYPKADRIHVVLDNLNTHNPRSLLGTFGPERGAELAARFVFPHTPKHASWLNPAEIEASLVSRECLGRDCISTLEELRARVRKWSAVADQARRKINWKFTVHDAERVFGSWWFDGTVSEH